MSEAKKQTLKQYNEPTVLPNLGKTDKKQYNEPTVLTNLVKTDTPHNTQKKIAEEVGLGQGTIGRVEVILKEAPEEVKEKLRCGVDDLTINKVYNEIKIKKRKEEIGNQVDKMSP